MVIGRNVMSSNDGYPSKPGEGTNPPVMLTTLAVGLLTAGVVVLLTAGCGEQAHRTRLSSADGTGFAASQVRLNPSFTCIKAGSSESPTIEAFVELMDQFGDPVKAVGQFRFEIFKYRPAFSDPRGRRFEDDGIQLIDLRDIRLNQQNWDSITRSYRLSLKLPEQACRLKRMVLQVTFIAEPQYRLRDMLTIEQGK